MDYLNGLPMDYPKWTTLKFAAKINLTKLERVQNVYKMMRSIDGTLAKVEIQRSIKTHKNTIDQKSCDFLNSQTFPTLTCGPLSQNTKFERVFLLLTNMINKTVTAILHLNRWPDDCS